MIWFYVTTIILVCISIIGFIYNWRKLGGPITVEKPYSPSCEDNDGQRI